MKHIAQISEAILKLAEKEGIIQIRDLRKKGIHPEYLRRLYGNGQLVKIARGQYTLPDATISENHSLAIIATAVPNAIVCMLTALQYHDIGTQMPHKVWIAIERRSATPRIDKPEIRIFRFSGPAFTDGIEHHTIEGAQVKIYNPAKSVADCFKYRNKIGLDVALESLRDGWQQRKFNMDELWNYAKICRVANIMKPYLESLT